MVKIMKRIYEIVEVAKEKDKLSKSFDIFIITLISLNVIAIILESIETFNYKFHEYFDIFEFISVVIFTIEYLLRIWTCTENPEYKRPIKGRIKFVFTFFMLIDFFAILPFYLPFIIDLRFLRAVRLLRLFRLIKIARYSKSIQLIGKVLKAKRSDLVIVICIAMILLVLASSLLYYAERDTQPEIYSSIPAAMWWGVATLTTVGYGDIYPITVFGKIISSVIALLGIGIVALPTGILASGFSEEISHKKIKICPHCGKEIQ